MKYLTILVLVFSSSQAFSSISGCYKEISQAEKNECMTFEKDKAIGRFMTKVAEECADKDEIKESKGGSIYPMLLDECMAKSLNELANQI